MSCLDRYVWSTHAQTHVISKKKASGGNRMCGVGRNKKKLTWVRLGVRKRRGRAEVMTDRAAARQGGVGVSSSSGAEVFGGPASNAERTCSPAQAAVSRPPQQSCFSFSSLHFNSLTFVFLWSM